LRHSSVAGGAKLAFIFVTFATVIGLFVRVVAPLQASFPLNDGGLFYVMIRDIQQNGYALPAYTSYNYLNLPFAYPPLAFYVAAILSDLTRIDLLDILRLLPAFVSGLCVPVFYLLAKQISTSEIQAVLPTFAFALLPRTFDWAIMGGGITRSFGLLFALLTMVFAFRFYAYQERRATWLCILFGTLVVLTHPEATIHTAITALIFFLWKDRTRRGLMLSFGIAAAILVLSAPWWGTVLSRHGLGPFLASLNAARQNSFNQLVGLVVFFRFLFADEPYLTILSSIGAIGFFASLNRKQGLAPVWLFAIHFIEPRGGTLYMMIPLSLLVGFGLDAVILPGLNTVEAQSRHPAKENDPVNINGRDLILPLGKAARTFLILLFIYSTFSAYSIGSGIYENFTLKQADLAAFEWIKQNTPTDSEFLLLTGQLPLRDAWSEWFPVLAERRSQATVFGYEWINDGKFGRRIEAYNALQACSYDDANCLDAWDRESIYPFSYVYIYNRTDPRRFPLTIHLQRKDNFRLIFQNDQTMLFQKAK
jgi:hypothetical protein